jgi:hypothetical protein
MPAFVMTRGSASTGQYVIEMTSTSTHQDASAYQKMTKTLLAAAVITAAWH